MMELYSRVLKLPITTIISTGEILSTESQKYTQTTPDICQGAANRLLLSMIGNVFYSYENNGEYKVKIAPNKEAFVKAKFKPVKFTEIEVLDEVNVTNNPELLWKYITSVKTGDIKKISEVIPTITTTKPVTAKKK